MIFKILLLASFSWVVYSVGRVNTLKKTISLTRKKISKLENAYLSTLEDLKLLLDSDLDQKRIFSSLADFLNSTPNKFKESQVLQFKEIKKTSENTHVNALLEEQISISKKIILEKKLELELVGRLKKMNSSFWLDPLNTGK